jgi:hypothetical protein
MKSYKNVIATEFATESPWIRKNIISRKRKIDGFPNCKKLSKGALYENNGHIIYDSIRRGGIFGDHVISTAPLIIDPDTKFDEYIEGKSLYLGHLYSQYGHFITEGLSSLSDYIEFAKYDNFLFYPFIFNDRKTDLQNYHEFFFNILKIDLNKIRFINKKTKIESVDVAKQKWILNDSYDESLRSFYVFLRENIIDSRINNEKVYLSRHNQPYYDRVGNLKEIETLFQSLGFQILYPEEMSLEEQMSIYNGNNIIVSLAGTSLHNILFGKPRTIFIELGDNRTPNQPHIMQNLANSLSDSKYHFIPFNSKDGFNWSISALKNELVKIV